MKESKIYFNNEITGVMYCPKCKKLAHYTLPKEVTDFMKVASNKKLTATDLSDRMEDTFYVSVTPKVECNECGELMVNIDKEIAPAILVLNNLGYETMFCCEGHYNPETNSGDYPYIALKYNSYLEKYVKDKYDHIEADIPAVYITTEKTVSYDYHDKDKCEDMLILRTSLGSAYWGNEDCFNYNKKLCLGAFFELTNQQFLISAKENVSDEDEF